MYLAEYLLSIREFLEEYPTGENVSNENTAGQRLSYGLLPEKGQAEKILSYGFSEEEYREALVERAFSCIDEERKKKAERIRPGRARAASLGAGLLLQLAVGEVLRENGDRESASGNPVEMGEAVYGNVSGGSEACNIADFERRAASSAFLVLLWGKRKAVFPGPAILFQLVPFGRLCFLCVVHRGNRRGYSAAPQAA